MKREQLSKILMHLGAVLLIFGLGWFFGKTFGNIGIELWKIILIVVGIILIIISLLPKKKSK